MGLVELRPALDRPCRGRGRAARSLPCGRPAMTASSSRVAGCEPVEPAAITGVAGGCSRQRIAWARIAWVRRSMASIWPRSASTAGQCFADDGEELQRALPVAGEVALDQAFQPVERARLRWRARRAVGRARAPATAPGRRDWAMGGSPSVKAATSCASSASRSAGSMAGGRASALPSPDATSHSLSSTSPSGAMRGRIVGLPSGGAQEGLAQRPHRAAGRQQDQHVGQRQRIAAILRPARPCASSSAKRRSMAMVKTHPGTLHRQHALRRGERLRACRYGTSRRHGPCRSSRPAASARCQSCSSENGPSGESRNRRGSQIETLAKT